MVTILLAARAIPSLVPPSVLALTENHQLLASEQKLRFWKKRSPCEGGKSWKMVQSGEAGWERSGICGREADWTWLELGTPRERDHRARGATRKL